MLKYSETSQFDTHIEMIFRILNVLKNNSQDIVRLPQETHCPPIAKLLPPTATHW